jgi:hypothetical protein
MIMVVESIKIHANGERFLCVMRLATTISSLKGRLMPNIYSHHTTFGKQGRRVKNRVGSYLESQKFFFLVTRTNSIQMGLMFAVEIKFSSREI